MGRYLNLLNNVNSLFERNIIIYGTGSSGRKLVSLLKMIGREDVVAGYCTSNSDEWGGRNTDGIEIISIDSLKENVNKDKCNVVIASTYFNDIIEFLKSNDITMTNVYSRKMVEWAIFFAWKKGELFGSAKDWFGKVYCSWAQKGKVEKLCYDEQYCIDNMNGIINGGTLVYQPAKVGSSSVYDSLEKCGISALHIHEIPSVVNRVNKVMLNDLYNIAKKKRPIRIITMVREPISRDISQFFQLLDANRLWYENEILSDDLVQTFYSFVENAYGIKCCKKSYYGTDLTKGVLALSAIVGKHKRYGYEFDWFDYEIKEMFDVDIYEYPFDKSKGYSYIEENGVEILVITLEHLSACENIIREKLGIDNFELISKNAANIKEYSELYQEFKKGVPLSKEYIDFYYNDNYAMNHFYSREEQNKFRKKWEQNVI